MTRRAAMYVLGVGSLAGVAGGLAEVAWICGYAAVTNSDAALVARGVTETVRFGQSGMPVLNGLAIHMALAAVLGVGLALAIRSAAPALRGARLYAALAAALAAVWAVNFMIVLPLINPQFVDLIPYSVSFISKILFGVAAATALQWTQAPRALRQA